MEKINNNICLIGCLILGGTMMLTGCKDSFLDPDPLSVFEPSTTFTTEAGVKASLAICDRLLKLDWACSHNEMLPIGTEYMFSEESVAAATDKTDMLCNMNEQLTPNSDQSTENDLARTNSIWHFWSQGYESIKDANTVIQYAQQIKGMDDKTKNKYIGQGYFHRAYRYYHLVFQFGDVPLVTKLLSAPKQNYRSTKVDAILKKMTKDMEFAVQWVPEQKELNAYGYVNKGACRMLLAKLYLSIGEYQKAENQLDTLINYEGYSLMTNTFGTFDEGGEPQAWPITRNVIWDLHRGQNKLIAANKETIMGIPNRGTSAESFDNMLSMRILYPFFFNSGIKTTDGKQALLNIKRNASNYEARYDYMRGLGRGIATWRFTPWFTKSLWYLNGKLDKGDLRHSAKTGNWMCMDSLICNNPASKDYGKHIRLYNDDGTLLCNDSIRRWFDVPHYKLYYDDPVNEANISGSDGYRGATEGSTADLYLFRLAEAYLLRAEAKFYINPNDASIAEDLNILRRRAECTEMYTPGKVSIGDIMDERARELYFEEFRNVELKRVSLCLARSGRPDEWGNTYDINTYNKQSGTDAKGGSYWYQRLNHLSMYNKGIIHIVSSGQNNPNYVIDKHNMYWAIPESAISGNKKGTLHQNYGYSGYDENVAEWENYEDAIADEDNID